MPGKGEGIVIAIALSEEWVSRYSHDRAATQNSSNRRKHRIGSAKCLPQMEFLANRLTLMHELLRQIKDHLKDALGHVPSNGPEMIICVLAIAEAGDD